MNTHPALSVATLAIAAAVMSTNAFAQSAVKIEGRSDPRIRTVVYSPDQVITVAVARGVPTQVVFPDDEVIVGEPAIGKGSDCRQPEHHWCIVHTRQEIFVKPRLGADENFVDVTTNRHRYVLDFKPLKEGQELLASLRVSITMPAPPPTPPAVAVAAPSGPPPLTPAEQVANRMRAQPQVRNKSYSVAVGKNSEDIVPVMVFDDGTQTYFSFPNNRPLPTIFQTSPDQTEEMVNVRMDGDMLVADRVARRFVLRLGGSVIAIINEAFDIDGVPPVDGTTVPGVARVLRTAAATEVTQ